MSMSTLHKTLWTTFFQVSNSRKPLVGWIPSLAFREWLINKAYPCLNKSLPLLVTPNFPLPSAFITVHGHFGWKKKNYEIIPGGTLRVPYHFLVCDFWKHIEGQESTSLRRLCSTFCNLNPGNTRFTVFELFKGLYINPRLLLLILVCFELVKV